MMKPSGLRIEKKPHHLHRRRRRLLQAPPLPRFRPPHPPLVLLSQKRKCQKQTTEQVEVKLDKKVVN